MLFSSSSWRAHSTPAVHSNMSHRMPIPSSPGLPPSLYSGMSSLQINQAGPGSVAGSPYCPSASQPQKVLLKGPKAARHQSRRNEHSSSSTPWKDPREAAAASAGRRRSVKDDALFRQGQTMWTPLPPDIRPTASDERVVVMRTLMDHLKAQEDACFREEKRELARLSERMMNNRQRQQEDAETILQGWRKMEPIWLQLLQISPNDEFRQATQKKLDMYYKALRDVELGRRLVNL